MAARRQAHEGSLSWSVDEGFDPPEALSGFDAVVHLAGESLAGGRWTARRKAAILQSRREGTRRVVEALAAADPRPRVLVSASGIGIYGDTGEREVDEDTPPGDDFVAEVATAWEAEARRAREHGVRVACMRLGMVLGRDGGALPRMLPAFRLGVGGRLGDGTQAWPWVHLHDAVAAFRFALERDDLSDPCNVCAPQIVDNRAFVRTLGEVLHRPTILPAPRFALRTVFGEMADLLLTGQRALPRRLLDAGFGFRFPDLRAAFTDLLG